MKEFISRLIEVFKPYKKSVFLSLSCVALLQALSLISPWIYGKIIDKIIAGKLFKEILIFSLVNLVIFFLKNAISCYKEKIEVEKLDYDVKGDLANKSLNKMASFSIGQHRNENSGVKKSVIDKGEHSLTSLAYLILYHILPLVLRLFFTITVMLYVSAQLGLIVLIGATIFVILRIKECVGAKSSLKKLEDMRHDNNKLHSEIIRNITTIQINAQEEKSINAYGNDYKKISDFGKNFWPKYMFRSSLINSVIGITEFAVIVAGSYYVFYEKAYTPGYLIIFLSWSSMILTQLHGTGPMYRQCMEAYTTLKKYFMMMDVEADVKTAPNPIVPAKIKGGIEFKNVCFNYPVKKYLEEEIESEKKSAKPKKLRKREALNDVNFTIKPGQKVAFVGPSGAGKTTIAQLLIRAHDPDKGKIIIDGRDLKTLDPKRFRELTGYVEQDVVLFDDTLKHNIVFGLNGKAKNVTEEELQEVSKQSCLDGFFHRLEDGFETTVGEKGIRLSGGEQQRVGIARALIKNPDLLIFDEATSNLDAENEWLIRQAIDKVARGRTTIIIAHRLSTVKNADVIFVMDNGKIVGEGKHGELMRNCEVYKKLIRNQINGLSD